jgi:membrane associated rhomboid family serine protease
LYGRGGVQFSFGPPQTPEIIKNLLIANGLVYIAQLLSGGVVTEYGVVQAYAVWDRFQLWRIFTYMWLHQGFMHIALNMFSLWMFGSSLALVWGPKRFLRYYLVCGVGAGFLIASLPYMLGLFGIPSSVADVFAPTLGASGAVMGVLLAYSFTWPDRTIVMFPIPIPIKAIYLIPVIFFMEWASSGSGGARISHTGHLAGVLVGWIYLLNEGRTPGAPTLQSFVLKWRRWRMRQKIRAVHREDLESRKRGRDETRRFH